MASVNTQFSIAVHVMAAIAHHDGVFASEVLAGSVNANPVFVKESWLNSRRRSWPRRLLVSRAVMAWPKPKEYFALGHLLCGKSSRCFAIHTYPERKECIVSPNIKEVMGDVLVGTQEAVHGDLRQTTLADVVSKIRAKSG